MTQVLRRLGGFTASTLLTALATVASIPLLVGTVGASAWSDLVVGQTVGTFVGVVTAWGWAVVGPARVAAAPRADRRILLRSSLVARASLLLPSLAAVIAVTPLAVQHHQFEAVVSASAMVVGGLSGTWFFVGAGDARLLLLLDTLPRAGGVLVGAVLVRFGAALVVAPAAQLAGACFAVGAAVVHSRLLTQRRSREPVRAALARQASGAATAMASALYVALPLLLVSQVAPAAVAPFALADRLLRYGVLAAAPVSGFAQSWVPADEDRIGSRARVARRFALVWGALGACAFVLLGPAAGGLLTGGAIDLPLPLVLSYAGAAACILATQIIGPAVLLAFGDGRSLAVSTVLGLAIACVLVPCGVVTGGAAGAAGGLAVSELVVLCYQVARSSVARRPPGREGITIPGRKEARRGAAA